jgi:hypothetical protein
LAGTRAGNNLNLSFPTASYQYYAVQGSPDLLHWTNCQWGIWGDGTAKTLTVSNSFSGSKGFYRLVGETPTQLYLPQSEAFAILGYSCGGIQETVSAGFDVTNGLPTGVVNLSTSCGGSGRGGGYHTTKHTASVLVVWDLAGNVISATVGATPGPTTSQDNFGDVIYNTGSLAYLIVPVPAAPIGVTAVQLNDQLQVAWTLKGANPTAIISSTLIATPINSSASVLTATMTGATANGIILSVQPQTTYLITVANTTLGGTGAASDPISVMTAAATVKPAASGGVTASWSNPDPGGATDTIIVNWQAANPGNSPVDQYLVMITGSDGGGTFTQSVSGTKLTANFSVNDVPNWSVTVQAHNAAGWGPASTKFNLGGL